MNRKALLLLASIVVVAITCVSFLVLKLSPSKDKGLIKLDKAALVYERGEKFLKEGSYGRAADAFIVTLNNYSDSEYSEKSLRKLASMYQENGDYAKARYYYKRLLNSFPDIKDKDNVKSQLEKLNMDVLISPVITEDSVEYAVKPGDSLYSIASKFNTTIALIKKINKLQSDVIRPGQKLKINISKFSIFVDKSLNILILKKDGEPFKTYVVSTGKDNCTPVGKFKITDKSIKPVWYRPDGKVIQPDSEEYELGERWMGLTISGYGIHGTNDENTIGSQITMGCVRMRNDDVVELFDIVSPGTEVEIVN